MTASRSSISSVGSARAFLGKGLGIVLPAPHKPKREDTPKEPDNDR